MMKAAQTRQPENVRIPLERQEAAGGAEGEETTVISQAQSVHWTRGEQQGRLRVSQAEANPEIVLLEKVKINLYLGAS